MRHAVARTKNAFSRDTNSAAWFPAERTAAVQALVHCLDERARLESGLGRDKWLRREVDTAATGAVTQLQLCLDHPHTGYRVRLSDRVVGLADRPITVPADWRSFDMEIQLLAAVFLRDGRDGSQLGHQFAHAIAGAADTRDATRALRAMLASAPQTYSVCLVLPGVRRPSNISAFGFRNANPERPRWNPRADSQADAALDRFLQRSPLDSALITDVQACDTTHAAVLAREQAEALTDQYAAEHRAQVFTIGPSHLVLRTSGVACAEIEMSGKVRKNPHAIARRPSPLLEQPLRYAALARAEDAPVVKTLHSWIALESLARGGKQKQPPYPFLREQLAPVLALHSIRQAVASTWTIARKSAATSPRHDAWERLERWLGVAHGRVQDLNRWLDVLVELDITNAPATRPQLNQASAPPEAARMLAYVAVKLPPFALRSLEHWHWRLTSTSRLVAWCSSIEDRGRTAIERAYSVRNFAVHTGLARADGAAQVAHAAQNIVDCSLEVLSSWAAQGRGPADSISDLRRRHIHLTTAWKRHEQVPLLNVAELTRPGCDGITRP